MFASGTGLLCMPNLSDLGTDTDCGGARRLERIARNRARVSQCRDCDVRSLAGPEPDRQVFAKFKHLLRKAAARSAETICVTIGEIRAFTPNAPPISETQAMPNPKSIML